MRRILTVILIGICLGLALAALQKGFHIDEALFMGIYWQAGAAVVAAALLVNTAYHGFYFHKMRKLAPLLAARKNQAYIDGIEALMKTAKGKNLRNMLRLNLAVGYMEDRRLDAAIPILEVLSHERLRGLGVRAAHRINICSCYFETGQYEKTMAVYGESQKLFDRLRQGKAYGRHIALLDMMAAMAHGQYDRVRALLDGERGMQEDPRFEKAYREIACALDGVQAGEKARAE